MQYSHQLSIDDVSSVAQHIMAFQRGTRVDFGFNVRLSGVRRLLSVSIDILLSIPVSNETEIFTASGGRVASGADIPLLLRASDQLA